MPEFVECKCGDRAYPTNWSVEGLGRLWYCFTCLKYLDKNGQPQPYKVQDGKYQLELVKTGDKQVESRR